MQPGSSPLLWVCLGGLVAGTLDILYAIVFWAIKANVPATRILQSVASGLLGKTSFTGGAQTAALGLFLHFFIAFSMAFTFYAVSGKLRFLLSQPLLYGAV